MCMKLKKVRNKGILSHFSLNMKHSDRYVIIGKF